MPVKEEPQINVICSKTRTNECTGNQNCSHNRLHTRSRGCSVGCHNTLEGLGRCEPRELIPGLAQNAREYDARQVSPVRLPESESLIKCNYASLCDTSTCRHKGPHTKGNGCDCRKFENQECLQLVNHQPDTAGQAGHNRTEELERDLDF